MGIVYNRGSCKIVTDRPLTIGGMVTLYLNVPKQTFAITVRMATVRWMLQFEFGLEFLGMEELKRERLAQYLQRLAAAAAYKNPARRKAWRGHCKHRRFLVSMPSTLVQRDQFRHKGSIRDLSAKGCRVESMIIAPFTGMQVTLLLHIPGEGAR